MDGQQILDDGEQGSPDPYGFGYYRINEAADSYTNRPKVKAHMVREKRAIWYCRTLCYWHHLGDIPSGIQNSVYFRDPRKTRSLKAKLFVTAAY